ncbi:MAG: glycosyltransferase family 39 protein [Candidatus Saccharimonadales bacterium]|nr:glycosyltransferase family 39 protein [Candidatus Saccharimonadales bacterium]
MKRSLFQQLILYEYRYFIGYLVLIGVALYSMFWRLGTLVPGLNQEEVIQASLSTDMSSFIDAPLDPLFRLLQWLSYTVAPDPLIAARLPGALLGLLTIYLMYKVVTLKFSARIGIVTSIIFGMSSWLLSYARFSHPSISTVFLITALIYVSYKVFESRNLRRLLLLSLVVAVGLYHRYFVYFLLLGVVVSWPVLKELRHKIPKRTQRIAVVAMVLLVSPLVVAIVRDPEILRTLLNLPQTMPGLGEIWSNAQDSISHIFWQSQAYPALYLGDLPMLDIFSAAMVALGLYHLDHEISRTLSRYILSGFVLGLLILTLNPDPFAFAIMIPFVYVLLAAGYIMLVGQWNEIFPKNPIARMAAFLPLTILVISVLLYHHERYFRAWPRTPEVIQEYPESIGRLNSYIKTLDHNVLVIGLPEEASTYEVVTRTYDQVQFISTESAVTVLSAKTAIVTPRANPLLLDNVRDQLPPVRKILSSSSSFESTLFITYTQQ